MSSSQVTTTTMTGGMCKSCNVRPVYVENGRAHDFCGRRCMSRYLQSGSAGLTTAGAVPASLVTPGTKAAGNPGASAQIATSTGSAITTPSVVGASPSGNPTCVLSGCSRPAYPGSPYCGQRHRKEAVARGEVEVCLFCRKQPKNTINNKLSDFCSRKCGQDTIAYAPIILATDPQSEIFKSVANQFTSGWKHTNTPPTVHKVWKIFIDKKITDIFWQYKNSVEKRSSIPGANCKRRWHGTTRMCRLGDDDQAHNFCINASCSVCNIIQTSFQMTRAGQSTNFGRFGAGIYTSATSSKARSYVREQGHSPYKSMFLSDVVMGKTMKLTQSDQSLTKPPTGYDSIVGEPGGDLNYDEAVVYQNDAIRPLFLIIYS